MVTICRSLACVLLLGLAASGVHAADKRPGDKAPNDKRPSAPVAQNPSADSCAEATGSARMQGLGYTHVVTLKNGCDKPVECAVWTNVDSERIVVRAAPGESVEVITRRGSPAREVTADKSCSYR